MSFDQKKYASYAVAFDEQDSGWDIWVILAVIWFLLLLMGLSNGFGGDLYSAGLTIAFLAVFGLALLRLATAKRPAPKKLWVSGDMFFTEQNGKRGKVYLFSEITRVRRHFPLVAGGGRMPTLRVSSTAVWQIYVGKTCVAAFSEKMNNSGRLIMKLDSLKLITPYGTGVK